LEWRRREVLRVVPLLRAEGGEKEPQFGLVAPEDVPFRFLMGGMLRRFVAIPAWRQMASTGVEDGLVGCLAGKVAARVLLAGVDVVAVNDVATAGTNPPLFEDLFDRRERHTEELTGPWLPCRVRWCGVDIASRVWSVSKELHKLLQMTRYSS
jgi:hypothetical protein